MALAIAAGALSTAGAQAAPTVFRLPAPGSARLATSAPAPAPAPRYPVASTVIPAIIMSDGSVYANLGFGYVPVRRSCAVASVSPRVLNGSDLVSRGGSPLTTTQPAPAQETASQRMLSSARVQAQRDAAARANATSACYRPDPYGPVVVVR